MSTTATDEHLHPPLLHVHRTPQEVACHAADLLEREVSDASSAGETLVVIVPTGSTPIPFYREVVSRWKAGRLDLSCVRLFNMDEYVGLPRGHEQSYHTFMQEHLYQHVVFEHTTNKKALDPDHVHIPAASQNREEALRIANEYRAQLEEAMSKASRTIVFGGIGREPAHIAFNDFTTEWLDERNEAKRLELAISSRTRVVQLDPRTREANARFFDHDVHAVPSYAISVGMAEFLAADRVVIMATDASKELAVHRTLSVQPSTRVPASLLRLCRGEFDMLVTSNAYHPAPGTLVYGLAALDTHAPAEVVSGESVKLVPGMIRVHVDDAKVGIVGHELPWDGEATRLKSLSSLAQHPDLDLLLVPEAHSARRWLEKAHSKKSIRLPPHILLYHTPESLHHDLNVFLPLEEEDLRAVGRAIDMHRSQGDRTAFSTFAIEKRKEFAQAVVADDSTHSLTLPPHVLGLEGLVVDRSVLQQQSKAAAAAAGRGAGDEKVEEQEDEDVAISLVGFEHLHISQDDLVVVVAPHQDDAEIGTAQLLRELHKHSVDTLVVNVTPGDRSKIRSEVIRGHPAIDEKEWDEYLTHDYLEPAEARVALRNQESKAAVGILNPEAKLEYLGIRFGSGGTNSDDPVAQAQVVTFLRSVFQAKSYGRLALVLPVIDDAHFTHRTVTSAFLTAKAQLEGEIPLHCLFYTTPWSFMRGLFCFHNDDNSQLSTAIAASELLGENGSAGNHLLEFLGNKATALSLWTPDTPSTCFC